MSKVFTPHESDYAPSISTSAALDVGWAEFSEFKGVPPWIQESLLSVK